MFVHLHSRNRPKVKHCIATLYYSCLFEWSSLLHNVYVGDGTLRIWNSLVPQRASLTLKAHDAEVLTCSWCKYDQNLLATGGSDGLIRGWDLRNFISPVFEQKVRCTYYLNYTILIFSFYKLLFFQL